MADPGGFDFSRLPTFGSVLDKKKEVPVRTGIVGPALSSGIDVVQSLYGSAAQGAGKLTGLQGLEAYGRRVNYDNQAEAQANGRPDLEVMPWHKDGPSVLPWAVYQTVKQAPIIASYMLGAKGYKAMGGPVPKAARQFGAMVPRSLGGGGVMPGASFAARRAAIEGGARAAGDDLGRQLVGGTVAGIPMGFGSMYQEADLAPGGATYGDAVKALALSPVYSALDSLQPAALSGLLKRGSKGNILRRMATAGLVGGAAEVPQEGMQTALEVSFRPDMSVKEKMGAIVDAAITGGVVGGVFGGVGGIRRMKSMDPADITDDKLKEVADEVLAPKQLPAPGEGSPLTEHGVRPGDGFTAVDPVEQGPSFDARPPVDRPYADKSPTELLAGLGGAAKAIEAGTASQAVKDYVTAVHAELQLRNPSLTTDAVSTAPVEAEQRELDQRRGAAEQLNAPVSANTPEWTTHRDGTLLDGIRTRKWYADAQSEDEIREVLAARYAAGVNKKSDDELAKRVNFDPTVMGEPIIAPTELATEPPEVAAPPAAAPDSAFSAQWKADTQKAGRNDKRVRTLKPVDEADAQRQIYQALGKEGEIGDGLEALAKKYGVLDDQKRLTPQAVAIAQQEPIPASTANKAAKAQGFTGDATPLFVKGVKAYLGGQPETEFDNDDAAAAYNAGAAWAAEHNSVPKGALKRYRPSEITDRQVAEIAGTAPPPETRVVPPEVKQRQTVNKAIEATQAAFGSRAEDITELKKRLRSGDVDGTMQGLLQVQRGERLFQQGEREDKNPYPGMSTKETPFGTTVIPQRSTTIKRILEGVDAPQQSNREVTRAEAAAAIRKYELEIAIDDQFLEGKISKVEARRLTKALREGKIADVIARLPAGATNVRLATPKAPKRVARVAKTERSFHRFLDDIVEEIDNEIAEAAEAAEVPELDGRLSFDVIKTRPGANVGRLADLLGAHLYGATDMGNVSIKEILQNSYDAIKAAIRTGSITKGKIDIAVSRDGRTIRMTDNGVGMSADLLGGKFLEIAGTDKENAEASGGFGIAKMLFLYANKDLKVVTMRNGMVSTLVTSGPELRASLSNINLAPSLEEYEAGPADLEMFPDGHGTIIEITIPEDYEDPQTNQRKPINPVREASGIPALKYSPLFADIDVTFQRKTHWDPKEPALLRGIGSTFPAKAFTQFANVRFAWGNASVYISRNEVPNLYGNNVHILSNGLWQFSELMKKNPTSFSSEALPFIIFVDVHSSVTPEEPGYPFSFNRQSFTPQAAKEWGKVAQYINALYGYQALADQARDFGTVQYINNDGSLTEVQDLTPEIPEANTAFAGIKEGDTVTVVGGRLLVNGKELPELTPAQLSSGIPSHDELKVDPNLIKSDRVMIHDNVLITPLTDEGLPSNRALPLNEHMRTKFGQRWDAYLYLVGSTMKKLRDEIASAMSGNEQASYYKTEKYGDLLTEAVGVSIDITYYGVSTRVPFSGSFINPAISESPNPELAPFLMLETMVHEFAHFMERAHGSDFAKEMQRINAYLKLGATQGGFNFPQLADRFAQVFKQFEDLYTYTYGEFKSDRIKARGNRFADGDEDSAASYSRRGDAPGDAGVGEAAVPGQPVYSGADGGGTPPPTGAGTEGPGEGTATYGPLSGVAANDTLRKQVQGVNRAADKFLSTNPIAGRALKLMIGWMPMTHIVEQYGDIFPDTRLLLEAHEDRRATTAVFAHLANDPKLLAERMAQSKEGQAALKTTGELMELTLHGIDYRKSWEDNTHLHNEENSALLKEWHAKGERQYNLLKGNGFSKLLDARIQINEMERYASMSLGVRQLVMSDKSLRGAIPEFVEDPVAIFRNNSGLHNAFEARKYWRDVLQRQMDAAKDHIDLIKDTKNSTRLGPLETYLKEVRKSLAAMQEAPYFHLGRFGKHFVAAVVRMGADKKADPAAIDHIAKVLAAAGVTDARISRDIDNPQIMMKVETEQQRNMILAVMKRLERQGWITRGTVKGGPTDKGDYLPERTKEQMKLFINALKASFEITDDMSPEEKVNVEAQRDRIVATAYATWLDMLPDAATSKVLTHRKGRLGYSTDMSRAFAYRYNISVNTIASMAAEPALNEAFEKMRAWLIESKDVDLGRDIDTINTVYSELTLREAQRAQASEQSGHDTWRAWTHAFFLGLSPSYVAVNMTQLGVLLWPELARKHGFTKSAKAIGSVTGLAFKIMGVTMREGYKAGGFLRAADGVITAEALQKAIGTDADTTEFLMNMIGSGKIDIGSAARELSTEAEGTDDSAQGKALRYAASAGMYSETLTRLIASLAARELHKGMKDATKESTIEYAKDVVREAMLEYSTWNTARHMGKMGLAGPFTPVMMSFLQYSVQVTWKLYRELDTAFVDKAVSEKEKVEARKFLTGHLTAVTTLAGVLGLPFATVAAWALEKLVDFIGDDDEPFDATAALRDYLYESLGPEWGEIASRGAPRYAGFDISARVGEQNLMPLTQWLVDKRKWKEASAEAALRSLGAPVGMYSNFADGLEKASEGEVLGAMVAMAPNFLKGPLKAYQMSEKGYVDTKGNKMPIATPKTDAYMWQLLGFTPSQRADYSEARGDTAARDIQLERKAEVLRRHIVVAIETGNDAEREAAIDRAVKFDRGNTKVKVMPGIIASLKGRARDQAIAAHFRTPVGVEPKDITGRKLTRYANVDYQAQ